MTLEHSAVPERLNVGLECLGLLADLIAGDLRPGDCVALSGDLGAGKTTFASHLVRALMGDESIEVGSPTYPIVQVYDSEQLTVGHFDFYRLAGSEDVEETGFGEILDHGVALVEWPERCLDVLPEERLELRFDETADEVVRAIGVAGFGRFERFGRRIGEIWRFVAAAGWGAARLEMLHGDASSRRYYRIAQGDRTALIMDVPAHSDGPRIYDGRSYGEVVHLAEDVQPFVAVDAALRAAGISAPEILAQDIARGLLLIEDLGDEVYGVLAAGGSDQEELWRAGVDVLLHLAKQPVGESLNAGHGVVHRLAHYDRQAMAIEAQLLLQWYWPAVKGAACSDDVHASFEAAWQPLFDRLLALPCGWVLRDFHSPNLIWLGARSGIARAGVIDFQDAVSGHAAYDLVSLLQDARVDVGDGIEERLKKYYVERAKAQDPAFREDDFRFAYGVLGAQRNTKILGIFARLALRDGKTQYLRHLPRIWRYVERNLEVPELAGLARWYDEHLPRPFREWRAAGNQAR